jgi:eukaryotic-like serine/threonine-protein kinase
VNDTPPKSDEQDELGLNKVWQPDPLIGKLVGDRYRVSGVIGRGGMGVVYEAVHEQLHRSVAVKIVSADYAHDERVIARFMREARTVAQIGHPHIVDVYDLGSLEDQRPYLVMERLYGTTFNDMLHREGRMTPARVVELLEGVAAALDLVHAKGIIHRDIKLENLMLTHADDGSQVVKILDFGIAAMANPPADQPRITAQNMITGTPLYIAPEAADGDRPDHRGDIYALAVCAYLMITGVAPFDSESSVLILMRKMAEPPPKLADGARDLDFPIELEEVVARGLARDPNDRYSSATAFIGDMRAVVETLLEPRTPPRPEGAFGIEHAFPPRGETPPSTPKPASTPTMASQEALARTVRKGEIAERLMIGAAILLVAAGIIVAVARVGSNGARPVVDAIAVKAPPPDSVAADRDGVASEKALFEAEKARVEERSPEVERADPERAEPEGALPSEPRKKPERRAEKRGSRPPSKILVKARIASPPGTTPRDASLNATAPATDVERARTLTREGMKSLVQGLIPQAIASFRDATRARPSYAPAWRGLGLANEKMGRAKEAIEAYTRYLKFGAASEDRLVLGEVEARLEALEGPRSD